MSFAIDVSSPHLTIKTDLMALNVVSPVHNFDCQTNDDATQIQNAQNANNTKQTNSQLTKILPRNPRHRRQPIICHQHRRALLTGSSRGGELPPRRLSETDVQRPDRQLCRRTTRRLLRRKLREVQRQRRQLDEDCRHKVLQNPAQLGPT